MPRRLPEPDYDAVLGALDPESRAVVATWSHALGLPPGGWPAVPPFRELLLVLAVLRVASEMPELSTSDALSEALVILGIEDDSERDTSPADSLARKIRRWVADADIYVRARPAA